MQSQQHTNYFEAILQLRPSTRRILDFVNSQISKRGNVRISKIVQLKTGLDLYLTDQRFAQALGKKLKNTFKGTLTASKTLHSRDRETNKDQYRVTICFRLQ